MFKADLHTHTYFSDGTFSPKELVELALKKKLNALAICDHDNIDGYFDALRLKLDEKIELLSGVELSCEHLSKSVHILGLGFEPKKMQATCDHLLELRKKRNTQIIKNLQNKGFKISLEDLRQSFKTALGRPQIAQYLVKTKQIKTFQEAFYHYIGNEASCFVPGFRLSVLKGIEAIKQANGFAILAHPHLIQDELLLQDLLNCPFDGIEANYAQFSKKASKRFSEIAQKKQWLVTGGSDFHGFIKENVLGSSFTNEETFRLLQQSERSEL